jgi:hypothetical protein
MVPKRDSPWENAMRRPDDDVFAYWERTWTDALPVRTEGCVDVLARAAELINDEWSEAEAGRELAELASCDQLHGAQIRLLEVIVRTPFPDVGRIRLSRVIWAALGVAGSRASR